jgi:Holliday junction resolvase-like predicted endonuclease
MVQNDDRSHKRDRKTAPAFAGFSETLSAWVVTFKGYQIIARRGNTLVFVEGKARSDTATAAMNITRHQQARVVRAAEDFVQNRRDLAHHDIRFDAMLVTQGAQFGKYPIRTVDAWRPGD